MARAREQIEVVVRSLRAETPEIRSFVLERADGKPLPPFRAGAHIDVEPLRGLIRQYSLIGDSRLRGRYQIAVKKDTSSRGGSSAMHSAVHEGSLLCISPPRNNFELHATEGRRLLLAGGIGVTPLLSMAQELSAKGAAFELHYFARSNTEIAFRDLLAQPELRAHLDFHFGLTPPVLNDCLRALLSDRRPEDQIYMCGPGPFMEAISAAALAENWRTENIYSEHFSAAPPDLPLDADSFVVRLQSTGQEVVVQSRMTVVQALRENGFEVTTNCEQGICGTCVVRLVEGEADHRDLYLSEDEHEQERLFAPCVSRARSRLLVLDM